MTKYRKEVEVSIPQAHDLGFCPINTTSQFPFTIFNPNSKPISYLFKFTQFIISPSKGILLPNSVANFKIQFKPANATVIVGTVVLEIQGQQPKVYRFSAVGKYPYISVKQTDINFNEVLVTKPTGKQILLKNSSEVAAKFHIESIQSAYPDNFYAVMPNHGIIPPKMNFNVKFLYTPHFCDTIDINGFKMICQSGNQVSLNCKGRSKRFNVALNTNSINFGQVKLEGYSSKTLSIINSSQSDTQFQFFTDEGNIFIFSENKGILPKQSAKKIIVQFRPRNTIAYYERVYCLVRNHVLLYVDLMGTCYDLLIKPIPLMQNHIDIFRKRVIEGRISQIQLKYIQNNALIKMAKRIQKGDQFNSASQQNFYQTANLVSQHPYTLHKQLFLQSKNNQLISITDDFLEFGFCQVMTLSGQKQIQITNKMQCKLSLYWIPQKRENLNGQYMTMFQVYPQSATLKTNVPVKFNITFRPLKSGSFFYQHLQFYAIKHTSKISKKTLQEFQYKQIKAKPQNTLLRNVKLNQTIQTRVKQQLQTTQVFPPISGFIRCSGHSFSNATMPYLPIMKVSPSKGVVFKPCFINDSVYDTIKLSNPSDTPIYFKIGPEPTKAFRVYPKIGLIEPKSFCIVGIQFTPKQYKTYKSNLSIILNDMPGASNIKLPLLGICTSPQISMQDEGKIFFAPTSVGVYSKKEFYIQNKSKTPVTFRISVPQKYQGQVYFDPPEKQLAANQIFHTNAYFTPNSKKKYKFKIPIEITESTPTFNLDVGYYKPGSAAVNRELREPFRKQQQIEIIGQGSDGNIIISEQQINFGAVKISENKKINVKICNKSQCAFYVDVALRNSQNTKFMDSQINSAFKLDFKNGIVPANSQIDLGITFSPVQIADFDLKLIVNARDRSPKKIPLKSKGLEPSIKCTMRVLAQGNYPQLEIIDIRNDTLSVAALWQNFQISQINQALSTSLSSDQKMFLGIQNLTFNETKQLQSKLSNYEWNLGYVSAKSKDKPRKVIITIRNFGGTSLDYLFKFPSDNKIEEQLWADPGEPTQQQAYQRAILQKNIFQIKPKVGHLNPGQVKDVELIYSPAALDFSKNAGSSSEVHMLRVVFQVPNGKSLVFNLKGTTLGPNQGLLTVKKTNYQLPNTPIGLLTPLRFPIQLNNVGSIKVTYKAQIHYEQGQFPEVFSIQNPSNFLVAGQNSYIYCLYKPLENKQYNFKVNIQVFDFSKTIQNLQLFFTGKAKSPNSLQDQMAFTQTIPRQRTSVSQIGSKVFFSIQDLDFGIMKAQTTKYRMIILYNLSKQQSLTFDFPSQSNAGTKMGLTCGDKFTIEPNAGTLEPNSFLELKLTLTTINHRSNYEGQIACNVTWAYSGYSFEDNEATQKETALTAKKETLFLRISKSADLTEQISIVKETSMPNKSSNTGLTGISNSNIVNLNMTQQQPVQKKSLVDIIFGNIINSTLNDINLSKNIELLEGQQVQLLDHIDERAPVWLGSDNKKAEPSSDQKKDFSQYQQLLLNDEFKQIAELIMENTFFNIVQQTTHKQNDFLRVSKKFVQSNINNSNV